jgi:1-deoxy-D-xylulose-5-phosphate synthase
MTPSDEAECRALLNTAYRHPGPAAVRYPRGTGRGVAASKTLDPLPFGRGETVRSGKRVALLVFGSLLDAALAAAEALDATVANMRFVKPLDAELVASLANNHELLVSIEENALIGGAGSEVERALSVGGLHTPLIRLGLPDRFIDHGDQARLLAELGLDATGIEQTVRDALTALAGQKH